MFFLAQRLLSVYPTLVFKGIQLFPKIMALPSGTLCQTLDFEKFHSGTSTVASVVNLVWRTTTVTSLSQ